MLSTLLRSFSAVTVVLILTACGYFCSALGWITPDAKKFLSRYLMRFAVPMLCAYSLRANLTRELLASSLPLLIVSTVSLTVLYLSSTLLGKRMGLAPRQNSVFSIMCTVSNGMFIGYPMCMELFGESCIPYVMLFFLVNTAFAQLVGVSGIRRAGTGTKQSAREELIGFFTTPTVIGVLVGFLLVIVDWTPPAIVMTCARYINDTVTPLALLSAGNVIYSLKLKELRPNRLIVLVMAFRFLIAPAIGLALCAVFGVTGFARSVLVVEMAMPVLTQSVVAATDYGGDEELAAQGVAISTLLCFITIPILMLLLSAA